MIPAPAPMIVPEDDDPAPAVAAPAKALVKAPVKDDCAMTAAERLLTRQLPRIAPEVVGAAGAAPMEKAHSAEKGTLLGAAQGTGSAS